MIVKIHSASMIRDYFQNMLVGSTEYAEIDVTTEGVQFVLSNGDFINLNPDGTYHLETTDKSGK